MLTELERARPVGPLWWSMMIRGLLAVAFGVIVLANPAAGALALIIAFGSYAAIDGVMAIITAIRLAKDGSNWGWWLVEGLVGLAIAALAFFRPGATLVAVVLLVAVRALILGIAEIGGAISWHELDHRWMLGLAGFLSVIFGVLLFAHPVVGGIALAWAVGVYAIIAGIALAAAGFRAWGVGSSVGRRAHAS